MFSKAVRLLKFFYYKLVLRSYSLTSNVLSPCRMDGKKRISIGAKSTVSRYSWLAALPLTGAESCSLEIGNRTSVGNFCHIFATGKISIGDDVLIADKVYISDNAHDYSDPRVPVKDQPILQKKEVSIGDGCWIGEHACVMGASVGKNSVVGANSVVTRDIPDYCVAVGSPARVIKKYDFTENRWISLSGETAE